YDAKALKAMCIECGFHRFLDEIVDDERPPEAVWRTEDYAVVDTPEKLSAFVAELGRQPKFCLETETTDLDPVRASLDDLAFRSAEGQAHYIPVRGPVGDRILDHETTLQALRPALTNTDTEKVGQNLKYDMLVLKRAGLELAGPVTDT